MILTPELLGALCGLLDSWTFKTNAWAMKCTSTYYRTSLAYENTKVFPRSDAKKTIFNFGL